MRGFIQIDSLLLHVGAALIVAATYLYLGLAGALLIGGVLCILLAEFVWVDQVKQFSLSLPHRNKDGLTREERRNDRKVKKQISTYVADQEAARNESFAHMYDEGDSQ